VAHRVSNLRSKGINPFTAVINPPHATILAVGAARSARLCAAADRDRAYHERDFVRAITRGTDGRAPRCS